MKFYKNILIQIIFMLILTSNSTSFKEGEKHRVIIGKKIYNLKIKKDKLTYGLIPTSKLDIRSRVAFCSQITYKNIETINISNMRSLIFLTINAITFETFLNNFDDLKFFYITLINSIETFIKSNNNKVQNTNDKLQIKLTISVPYLSGLKDLCYESGTSSITFLDGKSGSKQIIYLEDTSEILIDSKNELSYFNVSIFKKASNPDLSLSSSIIEEGVKAGVGLIAEKCDMNFFLIFKYFMEREKEVYGFDIEIK
jgi:hypothetical protein